MSKKQHIAHPPLVAAMGGLVAVTGALGAVLGSGATSPVWYGALVVLELVALLALGVSIGVSIANGPKRRDR